MVGHLGTDTFHKTANLAWRVICRSLGSQHRLRKQHLLFLPMFMRLAVRTQVTLSSASRAFGGTLVGEVAPVCSAATAQRLEVAIFTNMECIASHVVAWLVWSRCRHVVNNFGESHPPDQSQDHGLSRIPDEGGWDTNDYHRFQYIYLAFCS